MPATASDRGTCDACGKARKLKAIDSGQLLCAACRKLLNPPRPKHLATLGTLRLFASMGIAIPDDTPREVARVALADGALVRFLLISAWVETFGRTPYACGVRDDRLDVIGVRLALAVPGTAARMGQLQTLRREEAERAFAIEEKKRRPVFVTDEYEAPPEAWWDCLAPLPRDADTARLVALARKAAHA